MRKMLTFYTQPNVDQYSTNTLVATDPLFDFKNKYIAVHPPVYLAGIQGFYTQQREVFYGYYPQTNTIADTLLRGNGVAGFNFVGTVIAHPILQNSMIFSCLDVGGTSMILVDYPVNSVLGELCIPGRIAPWIVYGQINYLTGAFNFTFPNATMVGAVVNAENIAYQAAKPMAVLYYDDTFTIRPVPNQTYPIQLEVDVRPTELINNGDTPYLEQFWQYIAYGSSLKIFQDRMDMDSAQMIMPEFKQQERMVLRTTLTQQANERTVTIYTSGKIYGIGGWGGNWPY
jgi:hypothetical protein